MRRPLLSKGQRTRIAKSVTMPAPLGGMNTRDSVLALPKLDSPRLSNIYPREGYLEVRGGFSSFSTGYATKPETLMTFSSLAGVQTLFANNYTGIYNITSGGAIGASVIARTDGRSQWTMFGDGTSNWLCSFNGVDKPAFYNGAAWTAVDGLSVPAITGVTTTGLIGAMSYQGRLFLIEKDTLKFWYLPPGVVGGAATAFDLAAQCSRGGYLMAAMPYTYDGGSGLDDLAVFVTSMGEAIVYKGTDPGTAANWVKVGTYYIGTPMGRRCLAKMGGDLLVLTQTGVVKMSSAMSGITNDAQFYISDKIRPTFIQDVKSYNSFFGWEIMVYAREGALVVNVPTSADSFKQYIMNTTTGAWSQFSNWTGATFGTLNGQLYYANPVAAYSVNVAWSGTTDAGSPISSEIRTANYSFGSGNKKQSKLVLFNTSGTASATLLAYADGQSVGASGDCSFSGTQNLPRSLAIYPAVQIGVSLGLVTSAAFKHYGTTFTFEDGSIL